MRRYKSDSADHLLQQYRKSCNTMIMLTRAFIQVIILAACILVSFARLSNRILGGSQAKAGEIPCQVSVRSNDMHYCGGCIIDSTHILTAAHCFIQDPNVQFNRYSVLTGTLNQENMNTGEIHEVAYVIPHPDYDPSNGGNYNDDIAVIKLTQPIHFTNRQRPMSLPEDDVPVNAKVLVGGWGKWTYESDAFPRFLRKLEMRVISNEQCYQEDYHPMGPELLCARRNLGHSVCPGDSGSPLIYGDQVVGIAARSSCTTDNSVVFTRVSHYVHWIRKIVNLADT